MRLEIKNQERPYAMDLPTDVSEDLDYRALRRWAEKLEIQLAARDAEIERVAKEIENLSHGYESAEAVDAINECARIVRTELLQTQPKEPTP